MSQGINSNSYINKYTESSIVSDYKSQSAEHKYEEPLFDFSGNENILTVDDLPPEPETLVDYSELISPTISIGSSNSDGDTQVSPTTLIKDETSIEDILIYPSDQLSVSEENNNLTSPPLSDDASYIDVLREDNTFYQVEISKPDANIYVQAKTSYDETGRTEIHYYDDHEVMTKYDDKGKIIENKKVEYQKPVNYEALSLSEKIKYKANEFKSMFQEKTQQIKSKVEEFMSKISDFFKKD